MVIFYHKAHLYNINSSKALELVIEQKLWFIKISITMSLVKSPSRFFPAFPAWVSDFFEGDNFFSPNLWKENSLPAVNIKENEKGFEIELASPGFDKDDFKVEVHQGILTISATHKNEQKEEKENFTRREFSYSSFKRMFTLPENANQEEIQANYENGILKLMVGKKDTALPASKKEIAIS
jgi:HSP20 family protein